MINPTNCDPFSVDSQGIGDQGTVVDFTSYFHVVNCAALPFKPKMTIKQLGGQEEHQPRGQPGARNSTSPPGPATPTSNRSR